MGTVIELKKFFSRNLNVITENFINKDLCLNELIRKLEKELENKEALLNAKKNQFRQAHKEYKNCTWGFESLEDNLLITEEKQKARRIMGEINPLINHRINVRRNIEILKWEIRNLKNIIEKRRNQYAQLQFAGPKRQSTTFLLQPELTGF